MKNQLKKQTSRAFGKSIYLLGEDSKGIKYWLEEPKWDCDWYWRFGYVECYTNNSNPSKAKDITHHQHIDTSFLGKRNEKGEYIHNIFDSPILQKTTFSEEEGWMISELFQEFYLLRKMADYCHKKPVPGCNTSTSSVDNSVHVIGWYDTINKIMIPTITAKILQILSPNGNTD